MTETEATQTPTQLDPGMALVPPKPEPIFSAGPFRYYEGEFGFPFVEYDIDHTNPYDNSVAKIALRLTSPVHPYQEVLELMQAHRDLKKELEKTESERKGLLKQISVLQKKVNERTPSAEKP